MTRSHCLKPDACTAARPTSHCRRCAALRLTTDPESRARRQAGTAAYMARPGVREMLAERIKASRDRAAEDPAFAERLREHGRRQYRDYLSRPDARARNSDPETRAAAGRRIVDTRLADIPPRLRDEYRRLVRSKRMSAAAAREAIADMMAAERAAEVAAARDAIAAFDRAQRERRRRELEEAY